MNRLVLRCLSCQQSWHLELAYSVYEQQTLESTPCPKCGLYTLSCSEPATASGGGRRGVRGATGRDVRAL